MGSRNIVSTIKQVLPGASPSDRPYECYACGARHAVQYHSCPECGCYQVDRTQWISE